MLDNDYTLKNISLVILGIVALLSLVGLILVFAEDNSITGEWSCKKCGKSVKKALGMKTTGQPVPQPIQPQLPTPPQPNPSNFTPSIPSIPTQPTLSPPPQTCVDSDKSSSILYEGKTKGYVSGVDNTGRITGQPGQNYRFEDYCADQNTLKEYFCSTYNSFPTPKDIYCYCADGACKDVMVCCQNPYNNEFYITPGVSCNNPSHIIRSDLTQSNCRPPISQTNPSNFTG